MELRRVPPGPVRAAAGQGPAAEAHPRGGHLRRGQSPEAVPYRRKEELETEQRCLQVSML